MIDIRPDGRVLMQSFSWTDGITGDVTTWAVGLMLLDRRILSLPIHTVAVEGEWVKRLWADFSVDPVKLRTITRQYIADNPILTLDGFMMERSEALFMIDGVHRYVRAHQLGIAEIPCRIVPPDLWRNFIIDPDNPLAIVIEE